MFMLYAPNAKKRFTKLLEDKKLSKVVYVYGRFDEASGRPSDIELNFLESKGIPVIENFGDHHSMWTEKFMENLYYHLIKKETLKISIVAELANIIEEKRSEYGLHSFAKAKDSLVYNELVEDEMNFYGYQLLSMNKAIQIFKLNTLEFPMSSNAFDSLAEAYLENENRTAAIVNYKKALQINPKNGNASDALKKLQ